MDNKNEISYQLNVNRQIQILEKSIKEKCMSKFNVLSYLLV